MVQSGRAALPDGQKALAHEEPEWNFELIKVL
jgi:hypothetical protein